MKKHLLNLRALLMLCMIFVIGGGSLTLAEEYSFTITTSDFNGTSYDANNGTHTSTATCTTDNTKTLEVSWYSNQVMYQGAVIQWQKNKGYIYNTTDLGTIKSVTVNSTAGTFTTYYGTSSNPTSSTTVGNGYFTVKVGSATGKSSSVVVTFEVSDAPTATLTTVTFGEDVDDQTFSVNLGETFEGKTATVSPAEAGNVTYSSDNTEVASVNESTGAITIGNTAGKATITASFDKTDAYLASSAKYYINVIDPNGPVFYESFDQNDGTGGNDDTWSNISTSSTLKYDKSEWRVVTESGAYKCARFGTANAKGSATTPAIDLSGDKYILTFKAGAWNAKDEKTTIDVAISDGTLTCNGTTSKTQTIEMKKAEWTDYTMTIAGATNSTTITFTAKVKSDNRFFLDEVKIVKPVTSTLSLVAEDNGIYYATFSSSEAVIFPSSVVEVDAVSVEGSTLKIKELEKGDYFVKATSADGFDVVSKGYYVPANTGVLIQSLKNSVTYYYPYEAATVTLPANQLKPAPAEGGVFTAETGYQYYKLAYNDYDAKTGLGFYWGAENGGAFSVKAGTAFLAVPTTKGSGAKAFTLDGGVVTGISSVNVESNRTKTIYNIAGQRVYDMTKSGLYIVDGKKVVVK